MLTKRAIIYEIIQHLNADAQLKDADIYVDVVDSKVILSGIVPSVKAKTIAEEYAFMVPQVLSVENYLKVITLRDHKPGMDNELKRKVQKALQVTKLLENIFINVHVIQGKITLQGTVDIYWKKLLAEKVVMSIVNAKEVINNLSVTPSKSLRDELVMRRLIVQIARANLEIQDFSLSVQNGFVTVNGFVSTDITSEKLKAIILSTFGVSGFKDLLKVNLPSTPLSLSTKLVITIIGYLIITEINNK